MSSKIAVFFSNPTDTEKLQPDREHRALDQVIKQSGVPADTFTRSHAATLDDMIRVLSGEMFEVIHFSGHGTDAGIVLSSEGDNSSQPLSAAKFAKVLQLVRQEPKALLLMSCYSAESLPVFIACAPFVVSIYGPAEDTASIEFCAAFYAAYLGSRSVETAFRHAQDVVSAKGLELDASLRRRASQASANRVLHQIFPGAGLDSLVVDITEAEADIRRLGIPREQFLGLLTRKLRVHKWVFVLPKEKALIQLGSYFGVFTWTNALDIVVCHRILRIKTGFPQDLFNLWAALLVAYNDLSVDSYRQTKSPIVVGQRAILKKAADAFHTVLNRFFTTESARNTLESVAPDQFKLTAAMLRANLEMADEKWSLKEWDLTLLYLETALTTLHDFVSHLSEIITE